MNFLEAFALLSLEPGADRRSIQRAYAVAIKAIDQETEPERFAHIREAYELALPFAGVSFSFAPESSNEATDTDLDIGTDTAESSSKEAPSKTVNDIQGNDDAVPDHAFVPETDTRPQNVRPNALPMLEPLDDLERRAIFASDDIDAAQAALEAVLASEPLVALAPRARFEEQLALALQQRRFGMHNGVLLAVAARHFGWMDATSGRRLPFLLEHQWVLALDELATISPARLGELLRLAGGPDPSVSLEWVDRAAKVDRSHPLIAMMLPPEQVGLADHLQRWRQQAKRPPVHQMLWAALTARGYTPSIFRGVLLITILIGTLLTVGTRIENKEQVRAVAACDGAYTSLRSGSGRWDQHNFRQLVFCANSSPPTDCATREALLNVAKTVRQFNPDGANWDLIPEGLIVQPNRSPVYEVSTSSACSSILEFAERWNWLGMGDTKAAYAFVHVVAQCTNTPDARRHPALIKLLASTDAWPLERSAAKTPPIEAVAPGAKTSLQSLVTPAPTVDPMAVFRLNKPWPVCSTAR